MRDPRPGSSIVSVDSLFVTEHDRKPLGLRYRLGLSLALGIGRVEAVSHAEPIPDLAFATTDGREVRLSEFRGEAMVLVFLRHLG